MSQKSTTVNFGGLLVPLLTLAFVYAKLTDKIDWSWWWVLSPAWISAGVALLIVVPVLVLIWRFSK